jgi:hypothetical protein
MRETTSNGWRRVGVAIVVGAIAACSASASTGREGNLGHGVFQYQCDTDQDPICPEGHRTMAGCDVTNGQYIPAGTQCFPSGVAVGGRFHIGYQLNSSTSNSGIGNPVLKVVSPDYMSGQGDGQFKGLKPGFVGLYSQSTVDSTLVDYTLIKIEAIAKVQILDAVTKKGVPAQVPLAKGMAASFKITALDQNGQALAGAVESFLWETSDATIVSLADDPHTAAIHVNGVAAGKATLTAYADDSKTVKSSFDITVQ